MNKKVIALLLVLALAVTLGFAKDTSSVKVGAELGWGFDTVKTSVTGSVLGVSSTVKGNYKNNGFAGNLTAEYDFNERFGVKASFGLMIAGQANITTKFGDSDTQSTTAKEKSGIYFDASLDGKYTVSVSDELSLSALFGLEMVNGYVLKIGNEDSDKDNKNLAFGINWGAELSYEVAKNVDLTVGCSVSWLFVNNAKALKESASSTTIGGKTLANAKSKTSSFFIRPYVGAVYTF